MKKYWWTIAIIIAVIILAYFLINNNSSDIDEQTAKCIGENSVLYVQLGCHACKIQEDMFEDNYQYLNIIDCFYEKEKCSEIQATPTWEINGQTFSGVQSVEKLKELTGC